MQKTQHLINFSRFIDIMSNLFQLLVHFKTDLNNLIDVQSM